MNVKTMSRTVLLALLCVPASVVGIVLGYIFGCVIALILQEILAPGASYEHYGIVALGPMAVGAAAPWMALGLYVRRAFRRGRRRKDEGAFGAGWEQGIEEEQCEA